jgi:hypothetical protein
MSNDLVGQLEALATGGDAPSGVYMPLAKQAAAKIKRLRAALRDQKDRDAKGYGSTHAGDCYTWGPRHYECALAKIEALEAENKRLREALAQVMAHHDEDIGMDDHDDNDHVGWYGNGEKMSLTFGVLRRARAALEGT